jgi:aldehyde:ferredoxin oxidoreductase
VESKTRHLWNRNREILKRLKEVRNLLDRPEKMSELRSIANEQHLVGRGGGSGHGMDEFESHGAAGRRVQMGVSGPAGIEEVFKLHDTIRKNPVRAFFRDVGTTGMLMSVNEIKGQPTRNFGMTYFDAAPQVSSDQMKPWFVRFESCSACPVACGSITRFKVDGKEMMTERIEHQSVGAFATNCGVSDLPKVFQAHDLCDRFGMDSISTGITIAFAMECFEKGILTQRDCDGLPAATPPGDPGSADSESSPPHAVAETTRAPATAPRDAAR